jgi:hypothetical protein
MLARKFKKIIFESWNENFRSNLKKKIGHTTREMKKIEMNKSYISFMQLKKLPTTPSYHHTTYVYHPNASCGGIYN